MAKKQPPARKKSGKKGGKYDRLLVIGIIVAIVTIALTLWGPLRKFKPLEQRKPVQHADKKEPAKEQKAAKRPEKKEGQGKTGDTKKVYVAIVIDDLGQDLKVAGEIASLPANLTFAVMPGLPHSRAVADLARTHRRELLLHMPMEYRSKNGKPAPGMLRADMTPMDFLDTLNRNMESVPGVVGINNHEGSLLTENKEAMKFLMAELKTRDLMFLDSYTTAKSVAYSTAREFGLKAARRDVFLDNDSDNPASIQKQLDELSRKAKERGQAVGIGHPHAATIMALRKWIPTASRQGIEIVPVSRLMQ